jgi:diaminopimelate epimerase
VYASILNGYTEDTVLVKLSGGELQIEFDRQEQVMYMTGSAVKVFEGEW